MPQRISARDIAPQPSPLQAEVRPRAGVRALIYAAVALAGITLTWIVF